MTEKKKSKISVIIGVFLILAFVGWKLYKVFEKYEGDDAQTYFGITTLNTNLVSSFSNEYKNQLSRGLDGTVIFPSGMKSNAGALQVENPDGKTMRQAKSYVEYVEKAEVKRISDAIAQIKELKPTEDTKELINLSLDYFSEVEKLYKTDLVKLAKMIDDKAPKEEVTAFAKQLDEKNQPILDAKKEMLYKVAFPYAEKNKINVKVQNFSKPNLPTPKNSN